MEALERCFWKGCGELDGIVHLIFISLRVTGRGEWDILALKLSRNPTTRQRRR